MKLLFDGSLVNCSTLDIEAILRRRAEDLRNLAESSEAGVLVLL